MAYIYKITNNDNDKVYVGATHRSVELRWLEHQRDSANPSRKHRKLYSDIEKYGAEVFTVQIIEECADSEMNLRESYWISYYNSFEHGYNETFGGTGKHQCNTEIVLKLHYEGYNAKEIAEFTGYSSDSCRKILKKLGVSHSDIKRVVYNQQNKKVEQIDPISGNVISKFNSIKEALQSINKGPSGHISHACNNDTIAYGYKWKWAE